MKNIIKKIFTSALFLGIILIPGLVSADSYTDGDYGSVNYDFYDYGSTNYNDYGSVNYDYYDYGSTNYNDYGSVNYDYYDYGSTNYNDYGSVDYDYYDYGSVSYDNYDYGSVNYDYYDYGSVDYDYYDYGSVSYDNYDYGSVNYDYYDYPNPTYSNPIVYTDSNPIVYTDSNQIVYQEPYYEQPYYQEPYYEEPYYQESWYPSYVTYNDNYIDYGYYGDTDCNRNCGGDTVVIVPPTDDLDVVCYVSDRTIEEGDSVTFEAEVDGGKGPYTYRWTGDVTSNNRTTTVRFDDYGTYEGRVRVTDSKGRTATANCDVVVERDHDDDDDEDFDAVCKVSDRTIEEGDRVTFEAEVDGGDRPYDYDWSGDADQDSQSFSMRFNRSGRYTINLKVTDDEGRIARDTCEVRVEDDDNDDDDDDDDRDINISTGTLSSGGGTFASVGSVYLNQVPYTGPEDVAKGVAFVSLLLAWSVAGAMIVRKRVIKNKIAKRIADFKESNKLAKI